VSFPSAEGGRLLVELLCDDALTPTECKECSEVMLLLLLLSPPVCSSGLSVTQHSTKKQNMMSLAKYELMSKQ
jgi:hypothetical protein